LVSFELSNDSGHSSEAGEEILTWIFLLGKMRSSTIRRYCRMALSPENSGFPRGLRKKNKVVYGTTVYLFESKSFLDKPKKWRYKRVYKCRPKSLKIKIQEVK